MLSSDNPPSLPVTLGMDAQPANLSWSPRPLCPRQRGFCLLLCCRPSSSCTPFNYILSFYRCLELRRAFRRTLFFDLLYSYFLSFIGHPLSLVRVICFLSSFNSTPSFSYHRQRRASRLILALLLLSLSNVQHSPTHTHTPTTPTHIHNPYLIATFHSCARSAPVI